MKSFTLYYLRLPCGGVGTLQSISILKYEWHKAQGGEDVFRSGRRQTRQLSALLTNSKQFMELGGWWFGLGLHE